MKTFKNYLQANTKNTHLEHIEDEVFSGGSDGIDRAVTFLMRLNEMLSGVKHDKFGLTMKWDGAPALVCGINPDNKKFFVGTKTVFNKKEPKINYTTEDIKRNHSDQPGLVEKLNLALKYLPKLGIKGVIQGDFLFSQADLSEAVIDKHNQLVFTPNTITYAVSDPALISIVKESKIGIVFHTRYVGKTFDSLEADFGVDCSTLKDIKEVFVIDSNVELGQDLLEDKKIEHLSRIISEIQHINRNVISNNVDEILSLPNIQEHFSKFINKKIRSGQNITGTQKTAKEFSIYVNQKYIEEIAELKTEKGKYKKELVRETVNRTLVISELATLFLVFEKITEAKNLIVQKLSQTEDFEFYIKENDEYRATKPEGFVAIDKKFGTALKLVDRLDFSRSNFNSSKSWK